jgi:hypothetical protein
MTMHALRQGPAAQCAVVSSARGLPDASRQSPFNRVNSRRLHTNISPPEFLLFTLQSRLRMTTWHGQSPI